MKIKPEHLAYMKQEILANSKAQTWPQYKAAGLSELRWHWDLLRSAGLIHWICDNIYPYADDSNINAAMRHIMKGKVE